MTDEFGGVAVEDTPPATDEFGGVEIETDEFGGVPVTATATTPTPSPVQTTAIDPTVSRKVTDIRDVTKGGPALNLPEGALKSVTGEIAEGIGETLTHPSPIPTPFTIDKNENPLVAAGKEVVNLAVGVPQFFTSALGIEAAAAGVAAPTIVAGVFTVDLLKSLGEQIHSAYKNWSTMTPAEKTVAVTDMIGTGAFATLTGRHTAKGASAFAEGKAPRGQGIASPEPITPKESNALVKDATQPVRPVQPQPIESTGQVPSKEGGEAIGVGGGEAAKGETGSVPLASPETVVKQPWEMTREEFAKQAEPDYPSTYKLEIEAVAGGEKPAHYGFYPLSASWSPDIIARARRLGLHIERGPRKTDYIITPNTDTGRSRAASIYTQAKDAVRDEALLDDVKWHDRFAKLLGYGPEFEGRIQAISGPTALENKRLHRHYVWLALREGKTVPESVRAEYPDLVNPPTPGGGMSTKSAADQARQAEANRKMQEDFAKEVEAVEDLRDDVQGAKPEEPIKPQRPTKLKPGYVRLWRGEQEGQKGAWFSDNKEVAEFHFENNKDLGPVTISYVDVPEGKLFDFEEAATVHPDVVSGKTIYEGGDHVLPPEIASQAKVIKVYRPKSKPPSVPNPSEPVTAPERPEASPLGTAPAQASAEPIGMGGAVASEFQQSPQTPTSIKNAQVEVERAQRGLPPAIQPAKRTFGTVWDEAMAKIDNDPGYPDRLLTDLREKPRSLTDAEDATLLHRQIELQNEYGKATRDLAQAFDDGRVDAVQSEKARVNALSDQLFDLYEIGKRVGTETGRGLNARKMLAYEDFSLAKMELEKRAVNDGKPLTDTQRAEVVELNKRIEETQKRFDDYKSQTEARDSERAIKDALDEAERAATKEPVVEPHVRIIADKIKTYFDNRADAALKRLEGKLFTISPQVLADLTDLGVSRILGGAVRIGEWSAKMVEAVGEKVKPHLQTIWDASQTALNEHVEKVAGVKSDKVKRAVKGTPVSEQIDIARDAIVEKVSTGKRNEVSPLAQKLARLFIEQGIKERDPLIDAVHDVLKQADPEFTRRETMDAISGYGEFKQLTKDEVSVQLRDLKGQMQQVAKIEDMQAKMAPKKTGIERRSPSDEERRLIKLVNEQKKKGGFVVTDPATQLASALQARKTYYTNRISDLKTEIASRERMVKTKTPSPTDSKLDALKAEYETLRKEHDEIFDKPGLTDAQRLEMAEKSATRQIAELERQIKTGEIFPAGKNPFAGTSPSLEAARARIEALKSERQWAREAAQPGPDRTPDALALTAKKARLARQIADLRDRLARGDFTKKPKREIILDAEGNRLSFEAAQAKADWHKALMLDRLAKRSTPVKILAGIGEALNTSRAVLTSMDLSAVLRQGGFITLAHPIRAAKSFPAMFKAFRSEAGQHAVDQQILARKNYRLYQQGKLYLSEHGQSLSKMEEAYMSRWADKIPLVAGSQRAYVTFLNKLRADSFDAMASTLGRSGELTPVEVNAIANFVNVATGRGSLGMKENALVGLNTVFFAPRYVASRFQLMAGQPLYRGTARTRKAVAVEYGRYLAGAAIVYALAQLDGADVEQDPRSSDFGKIKYGNTRLDPMSGLLQNTVLMSRLASGGVKTANGGIQPIRGDKIPFGGSDAAEVISRFLRSKLSPAVGTGVNLLTGKDVVGQPVTAASTAQNLLIPLSFQDIYKTMIEQGIPRGTALAILAEFGMGLQNYEAKKSGIKPTGK